MSIRDFNNVIRKPGCIGAISVISLIAMGSGVFAGLRGCSNGDQVSDQNGQPPQIIGTVGDYPIDARSIESEYKNELASRRELGTPGPAQMASFYGSILEEKVNFGLHLLEANKKGVAIGDNDIKRDIEDAFNRELTMKKAEFFQAGKLKAGATEAEFEKVFEAETKQKFSIIKELEDKEFKAVTANPATRSEELARASLKVLPEAIAKTLNPSIDQLKATYVTLIVKRVFLTGGDVKDQLAKVQADLKSGVPFETVIDRYSKDTTNKGKKPSETETSLTRDQLLNEPLKALLTLKAGDVSEPIVSAEGTSIYKVIRINPELPKNFEATKAQLLHDYALSLANDQIASDIKVLKQSGVVKFSDPGWSALYDLREMGMGPDRDAKLASIIAATVKVVNGSEKGDQQAAALAYYAAVDSRYSVATGANKDKLVDDRINSLRAVGAFDASVQDDLELARLLAKKNSADETVSALLKAIEDNPIGDPQGEGNAVSIDLATKEYETAKVLNELQVKKIESELDRWRKDKKDQDDERAQMEASRKAAEADQAKAKAEFEKAKAAADKKAAAEAKPAVSGAKPPAGGAKPAELPSLNGPATKSGPSSTAPSPTAPATP